MLLKLLKYNAFQFFSFISFAHAYVPLSHWPSLTEFKNAIFEFKLKQFKYIIIKNSKTMRAEH